VSNDGDDMKKKEIARQVLSYLNENPDATDTLEGILQWWLLDRKIKYQIGLVKSAVDELVEQQLIFEDKTEDSRTRYLVNKKKSEQIRTLLNGDPGYSA
jgi:hypothetical protein